MGITHDTAVDRREMTPAEENFWAQVDLVGDERSCWLWLGSTGGGRTKLFARGEYGRLSFNGKMEYAHRLAYRLTRGEIPTGRELDHLCRTKLCVRPSHLAAVSHAVNVRRWAAQIRRCPLGHPYDETSTYVRRENGWRQCKTCNTLQHAVRRARRRLAAQANAGAPRPRTAGVETAATKCQTRRLRSPARRTPRAASEGRTAGIRLPRRGQGEGRRGIA